MEESQIIVVHERERERQLIEQAARHISIARVIPWATLDDFDLTICNRSTLVILHASNEIEKGPKSRNLLRSFTSASVVDSLCPYALLGEKLRKEDALGVVVISNEYDSSVALISKAWSKIWPCSVEQWERESNLFITALVAGERIDRDCFVVGLDKHEPARQALTALYAFDLRLQSNIKVTKTDVPYSNSPEFAMCVYQYLVHCDRSQLETNYLDAIEKISPNANEFFQELDFLAALSQEYAEQGERFRGRVRDLSRKWMKEKG
jgi:hypothetical protein